METKQAVQALSALAHEGRLSIFRELVQAGPDGLAAGEVGRRVGIAPNTLSASLTILAHAGLVSSQREGRSIIYSAGYGQMGELLGYLMQDCCGGAPQVCAPLAVIVSQAACCAADAKIVERESA
jgi:DNA-binding transcriptional ArsR family regulator